MLSALVKRIVDAKADNISAITLWGTGIARREFMHVDDLARAILFMLDHYDHCSCINIGFGHEISIKDLSEEIAKQVSYNGVILWDSSKPDGMLKKCMDVTRMKALGFVPEISLKAGIGQMIDIYIHHKEPT